MEELNVKLFRYISNRIEEIDKQLVELGEEIGESQTVNQTITLRTQSQELIAGRRELGVVLREMNRPVKPLPTIKYINNEKRG